MIIISDNKNKGDIVIGKSIRKPVFDISNFKLEVNTTVWSYLHGKGIVIDNKNGYKVKFGNKIVKFTTEGKLNEEDIKPVLFLDEDYLIEILKLRKNQIQDLISYARFLNSQQK